MKAHGIAMGWVSEKTPRPERAKRIRAAPSGLNLIATGSHGDAMGFRIESRWDGNMTQIQASRGLSFWGFSTLRAEDTLKG